MHNKLKQIAKLTITDSNLLESVVEGISVCFEVGYSPWMANITPTNQGNRPMADNIFKQVPSDGPNAYGAVNNPGMGYKSNTAIQYTQTSRNIGQETRDDKSHYEFPRIKHKSADNIKQMQKVANKHIPISGDKIFAPIRYYNNYEMRGPWDGPGGTMSVAGGGAPSW